MTSRALFLFCILSFQYQTNATTLSDCYKLSTSDEKVACLEKEAVNDASLIAKMPPSEFAEKAKSDILKWEVQVDQMHPEFNNLTFHEDLDERTICGEVKVSGASQTSRFIKSFDLKTNSFRSTWFPSDTPKSDMDNFKLRLFETKWSVRCVNAQPIVRSAHSHTP